MHTRTDQYMYVYAPELHTTQFADSARSPFSIPSRVPLIGIG
jgi:hypothetical protein